MRHMTIGVVRSGRFCFMAQRIALLREGHALRAFLLGSPPGHDTLERIATFDFCFWFAGVVHWTFVFQGIYASIFRQIQTALLTYQSSCCIDSP